MPTARGYIRCSHKDSKESGLGLEAQARDIAIRYTQLALEDPTLKWGGNEVDAVVSAYCAGGGKPFLKRDAGKLLDLLLLSGDTLIVARVDRFARDQDDASITRHHFQQRGVKLVFCDLNSTGTSAIDKLTSTLYAFVAEIASEQTSIRTKAAFARKRARLGRQKVGGKPTLGYMYVGRYGNRHEVPDRRERQIMEWVRTEHRQEGHSYERIYDDLEEVLATRENRTIRPRDPGRGKPKHWYREYSLPVIKRMPKWLDTIEAWEKETGRRDPPTPEWLEQYREKKRRERWRR